MSPLWFLGALFLALTIWGVTARLLRRRRHRSETVAGAISDFHWQREYLEAQFVEMAEIRGQPAGWTWEDCEFQDEFVLACKRGTGSLRALVRITIVLNKIGGDLGDDSTGETRVQYATAIFLRSGDRWATEGRTVLDLDPEETVERFSGELERIA